MSQEITRLLSTHQRHCKLPVDGTVVEEKGDQNESAEWWYARFDIARIKHVMASLEVEMQKLQLLQEEKLKCDFFAFKTFLSEFDDAIKDKT